HPVTQPLTRESIMNLSLVDRALLLLARTSTQDPDREREPVKLTRQEVLNWWEKDPRGLAGVDLTGIDLSGAILPGADLSGACLRDAVCLEADLLGARLAGANLSACDLSGANLTGADLRD